MQMKSTMTDFELIPCFRKRFARKYGCRFQWYLTFHVSFNEYLIVTKLGRYETLMASDMQLDVLARSTQGWIQGVGIIIQRT